MILIVEMNETVSLVFRRASDFSRVRHYPHYLVSIGWNEPIFHAILFIHVHTHIGLIFKSILEHFRT